MNIDSDNNIQPESTSGNQAIDGDWKHWKPLFIVTSAYSILAFLAGLASQQPGVMGVFFLTSSLVFSMVQLTSVYAALGNGSYLKRLCLSHLCGSVFFFSLFGGFTIRSSFPLGPTALNSFLMVGLTASLSSQVAFGIFRLFRGWRFHRTEASRGPVYSLQDLFVFTLFVAIVFAALNIKISDDFTNTNRISLVFTSFSFFFFGTLVFGVTTVATTMRTRDVENGCGVQFLILAIVAFVVTLPLLSIGAPIKVSGPVLMTLAGVSLFSWLPIAILKSRGFVLSRGRDS